MIISQALIDSEISREKYTTSINEKKRYRWLKEDIRMVKSQKSNAEKDKLIEKEKGIGTNEIIRWNNRNT